MASKSQIEQLLDVLEQCEPGSIPQVVVAPKAALQTATETIAENDTISGTSVQCGLVADSQGMSGEEAEELFAICDDIRQMVGNPVDAIVNTLTGDHDTKHSNRLIKEDIEVLESSATDNVNRFADEMNFLNDVFGNGNSLLVCPPSPVSSGSSPSQDSFDNIEALLSSSSDTMFSSSDDDSLLGDIHGSFQNRFVDDRFHDLFPSLLTV